MHIEEESGKVLAILGLLQVLFTLVVGALFTLMLLFGEPVDAA